MGGVGVGRRKDPFVGQPCFRPSREVTAGNGYCSLARHHTYGVLCPAEIQGQQH
jgi:hypothetical protein